MPSSHRDTGGPSARLSSAWAKSLHDGQWLPLITHLDDTAGVARHLWDHWLPAATQRLVERSVPEPALARKLSIFFAAGHDVGKCSDVFSAQDRYLRERMTLAGYPAQKRELNSDVRRASPHSLISAQALSDLLADIGVDRTRANTLTSVPAGHHGVFPGTGAAAETYSREARTVWAEDRRELWSHAQRLAELSDEDLRRVCAQRLDVPTQVVLTGFLIVCDWIASNNDLHPLGPHPASTERTRRALERLHLPGPWKPILAGRTRTDGQQEVAAVDAEALFRSRFDLPPGASPRPIQFGAVEAAMQLDSPGLILVEAPTGEGKTEAALAAAEVLAARFGCGGVTVALPTCATSDAMFERILDWLDRSVPSGCEASAILSHSRAQFNDSYVGLFASGHDRMEDIYDDEAAPGSVTAHWWLRAGKKSALADFTVGTIDQVLFGALKSRHLMLRHLGLAGKVVVLDEIHSADTYMSVFLDRVLEWLAAMQVPVVALSATLSPERRRALLHSYRSGRSSLTPGHVPELEGAPPPADLHPVYEATAYPLISCITSGPPALRPIEASGRGSSVRVSVLGDEESDLVTAVLDAVSGGGCVAVVRNTVVRAQRIYSALKEQLGPDVMLLHSRFIAVDRRELERRLVESLGPDGDRPPRLVVVATQVVEQSLDIDFDRMYSDVAPMDLLIQRMGRVHRHRRTHDARPVGLREPHLVLTGVTLSDSAAPTFDRGASHVYGSSLLLRTTAVLGKYLSMSSSTIDSPAQVAPLVRATYDPDLISPAGWEVDWTAADRAHADQQAELRRKAQDFLLAPPRAGSAAGWNSANQGDDGDSPAAQAQVRDIENSIEVVVVHDIDGELRSLDWLGTQGGKPLGGTLPPDDDLARAVAMCTLTLPAWVCYPPRDDMLIKALEARGPASWQNSPWLKGVLPLPLDENLTLDVTGLTFSYDKQIGLTVTRKDDA